jgi:hypothetical protein
MDLNFSVKLEARLPLTRGNLKIVAVMHATRSYKLGFISQEEVDALTRDMKYIYPALPNASRLLACNGHYSHLSRVVVLSAQSRTNTRPLLRFCMTFFSDRRAPFPLSRSVILTLPWIISIPFRYRQLLLSQLQYAKPFTC